MKILHFSTSDTGGASEATLRLNKAFQDHGHKSVMIVNEKHSSNNTVIQYKRFFWLQKILNLLTNTVIRSNCDYYFLNPRESVSLSNTEDILSLSPYNPDIIMLHWISGFINMKIIYEIQKRTQAKVFWLMLDMAPMTGGCHYAWQCHEYQKKCGNCPAIHSDSPGDLSAINFSYKQKYIDKIQPVVIAPTHELYEQCKKSALFKNSITHKILLPINLKEFYPGNKKALRQQYNIPLTKKVICFRSDNPNQKRKGFDYIVRCLVHLNKMKITNVHLAIIGSISECDMKKIIFPCMITFIKNNTELADIYRLSDVFLCASIQDSGPMMINEAIASGLPVISFPIGVTKDLIIEGKTGFIAQMKDPIDLADKINILLSLNAFSYKKMSKSCRELAIEKLDFSAVIKQYEKIL